MRETNSPEIVGLFLCLPLSFAVSRAGWCVCVCSTAILVKWRKELAFFRLCTCVGTFKIVLRCCVALQNTRWIWRMKWRQQQQLRQQWRQWWWRFWVGEWTENKKYHHFEKSRKKVQHQHYVLSARQIWLSISFCVCISRKKVEMLAFICLYLEWH